MVEQSKEVRREMMASIREHLAASAPFDAVHDEHHSHQKPSRQAISVAAETSVSLVERFRESLEAVAGHCVVVRDEKQAAEVVVQIVAEMKARRIAVSDSELVRSVMERATMSAELLVNVPASQMFDCDAGITGAQWAIAETGTLVLESDEERHRLASLVPPVHIALIKAEQIRQTLGEVLASLAARGRERLSRTVTFITGPSRTSDIELTLAIGVHGPGQLFVIIIGEESSARDA